MDMGDRIQRAWRAFVRHHVDAEGLRETVGEIEWADDVSFDVYFYVVIGKRDGEPYIDSFDGPTLPDYSPGASPSKLVAAIPVHQGMTKNDLLDFDVAEETAYWDHPDWSAHV